MRDHKICSTFSSHTFSALNRSDCFVDSTSLDAPFSKMSYKSRELKWMIRSSLSVRKQQNEGQKVRYWLWWLWVNALLNREALWAASRPSPVWGAPSTWRRPAEKRHLVHPPHWAQRFQPGATEHPEAGNTPLEFQTTCMVFFFKLTWRVVSVTCEICGCLQWGRRCGCPEWSFSDRRSWGRRTPQPLLH